jgi:hypothetical protein
MIDFKIDFNRFNKVKYIRIYVVLYNRIRKKLNINMIIIIINMKIKAQFK